MSGCACHINPPCSYCVETFECACCGDICHPDEQGQIEYDGDLLCQNCYDNKEDFSIRIPSE